MARDETVVLLGAPAIAHAAHWGGFAGGALAVAWLGPRPDAAFGSPPRFGPTRWALGVLVLALAFGLGAFVRNVRQLLDLLRQLAELAPDPRTAAVARKAGDRLSRGVVAASSAIGV